MKKATKIDEDGVNIDSIDIVGADANNLKQVDACIPANQITVVSGVSGSGKSSFVADTMAAEANWRMQVFLGIHQSHLEIRRSNAFIGSMPPSIYVAQRAFRASSRTTIGTATGQLNLLRRLFIACAKAYSDQLGRFIPPASPATYGNWLANQYRGQISVSAVPVYFATTDGVRQVERLRKLGVAEVIVRSETDSAQVWERGRKVSTAKFQALRDTTRHIIEANFGSFQIKSKADSNKLEGVLRRAFDAGEGKVFIDLPQADQTELQGPFGPRLDSANHEVDPELPICFLKPNSHLLSFNAPEHLQSGACKTCRGLGISTTLDENALIRHPKRSLHDGAFSLWTEKNYKYVNIQHETIEGLRGHSGFSPDVPWEKLPERARRLVLDGAGQELVTGKDPKTGKTKGAPRHFEGFRQAVLSRYLKGTAASQNLATFVCEVVCPDCDGTRWSVQARALRVGNVGLHQILNKPFLDLVAFLEDGGGFAKSVPASNSGLVRALRHHAQAFVSLGLGHLTGDRQMPDVSDGESRRARLAAVLNAQHAGLFLLLDEPARGLHDEDVHNMTTALAQLARRHTVVISEHRQALVRAANHVIELGPGAGAAGGEVVYEGAVTESSWSKELVIQRGRVTPSKKSPVLTIRGATIHNLHGVDCTIPLGCLTCLTGVSGSGKSSFLRGVLVPAVARAISTAAQIDDFDQRRGTWSSIDGVDRITGLVALDQKAPQANRRSIVATLLGVADPIRSAFGASPAARRVGLSASDFGLNAGIGRCQFCLGIGEVTENDESTPCPICGGRRYGQEAHSVRVDGTNICELLDLPISDLVAQVPAFLSEIRPVLTAIVDLGIGHLTLGRRLDTLSGGEVQRLRIANKLAEQSSGGMLFVLDEPAAGLHPLDVALLIRSIDRILDHGKNTVVLVEHNTAIIRAADWLIEFGPGGGNHGGRIMAAGSPDAVSKTDTATGRILAHKSARTRPYRTSPVTGTPGTSDAPNVRAERAENMKGWIRHLIGDDIAIPDETENDNAIDRPVVALDERFWKGRRACEIGGLDVEIAKLLLDLQIQPTTDDTLAKLAKSWASNRELRLVIHPYLKDVQIWGSQIPMSTIKESNKHIQSMGLDVLTAERKGPKSTAPNWLHVRATGDRFVPRAEGVNECMRIIADALALGGGYAELVEVSGKSCGRLGDRLVDLEQGIIAPMIPVPTHFSRHDRIGQCPMCMGSGHVMSLKESLIIGDRRVRPEDDRFLHPSAMAVMKGVRRSDLIPFLRRLAAEGLWNSSTPFHLLAPSSRDLLLYGCWMRPGHGTFLKSSSNDPSEVGAWLRWDGLYRVVWMQIERSSDAQWREAVARSQTVQACPSCETTGLAAQSKLLRLGECSLHEWLQAGTARDFVGALRGVKATTSRQKRTRDRILVCVAPLLECTRSQLISAAVDEELGRKISRAVVETFTNMPILFI